MTNENLGALTIDEIIRSVPKEAFGCVALPVFKSVPISNIVPDTMHLFLRIADQYCHLYTCTCVTGTIHKALFCLDFFVVVNVSF